MTPSQQSAALAEAIYEQNLEREQLFRLVASLSSLLFRKDIVRLVSRRLATSPVTDGDCDHFDDIAIRFGPDDRVLSIYRTIDGSDTVG